MLTKTSYHARRAIGRPRLESQGPDNSFDLVQLLEICSMQRTATPRCNVQAHPFLLCGAESSENEMKKIREARETQKRRFIKICSPSTCTIPLEIKLPTEDFGFVYVAPCLCLALKTMSFNYVTHRVRYQMRAQMPCGRLPNRPHYVVFPNPPLLKTPSLA